MRSLQLIFVLFGLLLVQTVQSAESDLIPNSFFNVVLPYDSDSKATDKNQQALLDQQAKQAMQIMLMRLTGRQQLIDSKVGQTYIQQARNWLANYNIKPRLEDGVAVGKNIEFKFDAIRLKKAFEEQHIKLWATNLRPKTMVMGAFVQQGRLQKLTQEILNYRIDVDYRQYPENIALPIMVPDRAEKWVFPVEQSNGRTLIQELLLTHDLQNLLSFKLSAQGSGVYELSWYLFSLSGSTIDQGMAKGNDRQALLSAMFATVMERYVKQSAVKTIRKNRVYLKINQLASGDLLNSLEADIAAQQPMIQSVQLTSVQAGIVEFDIGYQGEFNSVLEWFKRWPRVIFVGNSVDNQEINVNVNHSYVPPVKTTLQGEDEALPATNKTINP